ncbi:hypothetical protein EDC56_1251 [Sinobacterium caligoides]|uniref:Phage protein U n=1 Tax=Sinobacterium caligoides TaxID=933926 RepID=A0A3N2E1A2_9GAMM|nr:phage tail protein [Sinobacterium caligoides]ROS05702.1 hypothetical protein EDC56_1251 [Sinobacterium caligoides]
MNFDEFVSDASTVITAVEAPFSAAVMMRLGKIKFSVSTRAYNSLSRSTSYRWGEIETLNSVSDKQFLGGGEDDITLAGVIYSHTGAGVTRVDEIRDIAGKGQPLLLVDGRGFIHGYWVIKSISESQTAFGFLGVAKKQEFSVQISYYGSSPR